MSSIQEFDSEAIINCGRLIERLIFLKEPLDRFVKFSKAVEISDPEVRKNTSLRLRTDIVTKSIAETDKDRFLFSLGYKNIKAIRKLTTEFKKRNISEKDIKEAHSKLQKLNWESTRFGRVTS